jgi:hypothetical protein
MATIALEARSNIKLLRKSKFKTNRVRYLRINTYSPSKKKIEAIHQLITTK